MAVWATNVPEWVLLQLAVARVGAVLVTINPAYRPYELAYVLEQCDAKALFLSTVSNRPTITRCLRRSAPN